MNNPELNSFYTFHMNRKCLHCQNPIPDQEHASLKFCRKKRLPDGTVGCCKDDFHAAKRSKINPPYNSIAKYHKIMNDRIENLYKTKGERVTIEDLNRFGINLKRPVELNRSPEGKNAFLFVGFLITEININLYKISKNVLIR